MKEHIDEYLSYIATVRRYSPRTVELSRLALEDFASCGEELTPSGVRAWEVALLDRRKLSPRSVNQQMSLLSSFCKWMVRKGLLPSNPVTSVRRPKVPSRLPAFFREEDMRKYFESTSACADGTLLSLYAGCEPLLVRDDPFVKDAYRRILGRMTVSTLYNCGIRRAELISLKISDVDFSRRVLHVRGKGDKMREIPLFPAFCEEISLYLKSVELLVTPVREPGDPLLVTANGGPLYPVLVERLVGGELGETVQVAGRKSPHVLRHTLATELLENGSDLNSIKELLGHENLAATQVYTHNSVAKLRKVYSSAHPRAGGKRRKDV